MFCKNCGKELENAKFCPMCGTQVDLGQPEKISPEVTFVEPTPQISPQPIEEEKPGKGKGIASMILGIVGFVTSCGFIGLILAIISFCLGISAKKAAKKAGTKNGFATTGIVFSILTWVIPLVVLLVIVFIYLIRGMVLRVPAEMGAMNEMAGAMYY